MDAQLCNGSGRPTALQEAQFETTSLSNGSHCDVLSKEITQFNFYFRKSIRNLICLLNVIKGDILINKVKKGELDDPIVR